MDMTEKITEKCPFCKSDNLKVTEYDYNYLVICGNCGAEGPVAIDKVGAVFLWNAVASDN